MPDVKNMFAVYQNIDEVYPTQFLACFAEKRRNEKEKSLGGPSTGTWPPCDAALCRGSLTNYLHLHMSKIRDFSFGTFLELAWHLQSTRSRRLVNGFG